MKNPEANLEIIFDIDGTPMINLSPKISRPNLKLYDGNSFIKEIHGVFQEFSDLIHDSDDNF